MILTQLQSISSLNEEPEQTGSSSPLSPDEITRLEAKFEALEVHLEGMQNILREHEIIGSVAHKLHHLVIKGGLDAHALAEARAKLNDLEDAIQEMHMMFMMDVRPEHYHHD